MLYRFFPYQFGRFYSILQRISSLPDLKGKYKESGTTDVKKEPSPVPVKGPSARVKKGAIVSDEDEDDDVKPRKNRLRKRLSSVELDASDSEADKSLRAMMDIDDCSFLSSSSGFWLTVEQPRSFVFQNQTQLRFRSQKILRKAIRQHKIRKSLRSLSTPRWTKIRTLLPKSSLVNGKKRRWYQLAVTD